MDDKLPSLPRTNNRPVITWAFSKDTKQGDFKRFDTEGGYIVATLVGKSVGKLGDPKVKNWDDNLDAVR